MARCVARNPKEIVRQVAAAKELDSAKCSGSMAPVDLEHGKSALKVAGERTGDVFWASPSNQRGPNMVGSTLIRWQQLF